ncbi:MAG: precorrin-6y C5,15-methyltransferase (decarboxylating) subunit CbiE [Nitrospirae bacterium]|nr:precorrin-6y C5,15-methyltransferase (decarboxylating) subunit CbiE [Nitrospirota bacterium]MCL5978760.1 precorrin-6y C5,15-methyltransferase (decarboxylating) subunit CbiE [Nitrospirota bacterium]
MSNKLYVIGIGYKPLDKRAQEIILNSSVILASNRLSEVFKGYEEYETVKDKIRIINNVDETINFIHSSLQYSDTPSLPIVLLASGDPTFFGIGRRAVREFGKDMVEIIPDLSCIQLAFSRIKESWDDAFLMSLHGGPHPEKRRRLPYETDDIPSLLQRHNKIAILTDKQNNPSEIANVLFQSEISNLKFEIVMHVCEKLGYPDEKITEGMPEEIASMTFGEPNIVIIQRSAVSGQPSTVHFGLREDDISHSRGLITKDEVRSVTIHKLRLPQKGVFWDIGAGSGSVSIETARLYADLKVFAVEKDAEQINHIRENKVRFNAANIEIVKGEAPDVLNGLPLPDRVFIGGSGERLKEIMDYVIKKLVSLIVVNAATIETMNDAVECFENHGYNISISEISVSRAKTIGGKRHMSALNPIFIITGEK